MSLIYWDTMLFVYWLEEHPVYLPKVQHVLGKMAERGDQLCASPFTLAELLVGPAKTANPAIADQIREAFRSPEIRLLPFDAGAAEHFASIRAKLGVRPADAIHLACAAQGGADIFLTNDGSLARKPVPGIGFVVDLDAGLF
jgi:predicted nucleic acid-binding protein